MSAEAPASLTSPRRPRILVIDWLRGLGVVLMIFAHTFDAWLVPSEKTGALYDGIRLLSGIPSRLFLFLMGVSVAIKLERQLEQKTPAHDTRRQLAWRGLQVIILAYLFRIQESTLSGFYGGWPPLFRIDILNCLGASMVLMAPIVPPVSGKPRYGAIAVATVVLLAAGPFIGPAHFPAWLPQPLTAYIGGQRPMSWFPVFPWAAWAFVGVGIGHLWLRFATTPRKQAACFIISGVIGAVTTGTVIIVRHIHPHIIMYPNDLVQQMGPGSFFYRLGLIGLLSFIGWALVSIAEKRQWFSPMRQLGQTSLLIYWVHIDFCYGGIARPLRGKTSLAGTAFGFFLLTLAMLALSTLKTRYAAIWRRRSFVSQP